MRVERMSLRVQVVKVTHVPLPSISSPPPERVHLSLFDTFSTGFHPIQRLLFFNAAHAPPFPVLLHSLRSALSRALQHFFTLAGKLTYLPATGDVIIDCSPPAVVPGVAFLEAEADGDFTRLILDDVHDLESFRCLVPPLEIGELPAPVFALQVTAFGDQGAVVGFTSHHAVADGRGIWDFMQAWAAECRGDAVQLLPTVDRSLIKHPRGEEIARTILHRTSPSLPKIGTPILAIQRNVELSRRTFVISPERIQTLKEQAAEWMKQYMTSNRTQEHYPVRPPSTFVAISANAWIAVIKSKGFALDEDTHILIPADCRSRLHPPIDRPYFGNCVKGCFGKAKAGELLEDGGRGYARACCAMQEAIHEALQDPLSDADDWLDSYAKVDKARLVSTAGSTRFKVYDTDFGWGRPSRVELVSMNADGRLVFVGASDGAGIQLSVAIDPLHIEAFTRHFSTGPN